MQTGEHGNLRTMDGSPFDWASWTGDWVRCDEGVSLVGHSFGGATVVSSGASDAGMMPSFTHVLIKFAMLSQKGEDVLRIPVSHGLVLDPWLEPLPLPGPAPDANQDASSGNPKLMVINAEGFTLWTDHFKRLEEMVPAWPESALLTISGCLFTHVR